MMSDFMQVPEAKADFLPFDDDMIGDQHSLLTSNAALAEIVIDDGHAKKSPFRIHSKTKLNNRRASYDKIHPSPKGLSWLKYFTNLSTTVLIPI